MDWIVWDHELETGNARMDADHLELAAMFNRLRDTVESGAGKAACAQVLEDIIRHTKAHFEMEQRLMNQHGYPKMEQHAAEHAMLIRQVRDYRESFDLDSVASKTALMQFPEVWLGYHILFSDKDLAAFLAQNQGAAVRT
jgi:hemerythrin